MPAADESIAGVLVSLKPEFASAIAEGRKTVELRRRFPDVTPGAWLIIYTTQPVGAVVGMARIEKVAVGSITGVWRNHGADAAITRRRYRSYFASSPQAIAIVLGEFVPFGPLDLDELRALFPGFCAPQSWRYLSRDDVAALKRGQSRSGIHRSGALSVSTP